MAKKEKDFGFGNNCGINDNEYQPYNHIDDLIYEKVEQHIQRTDNPHQVTKEQIGLGRVDNTSDDEKPYAQSIKVEAESDGFSLKKATFYLQNGLGEKIGNEQTLNFNTTQYVDSSVTALKNNVDQELLQLKAYIDSKIITTDEYRHVISFYPAGGSVSLIIDNKSEEPFTVNTLTNYLTNNNFIVLVENDIYGKLYPATGGIVSSNSTVQYIAGVQNCVNGVCVYNNKLTVCTSQMVVTLGKGSYSLNNISVDYKKLYPANVESIFDRVIKK